MSRTKISTTIYITPEQAERLKLLNERTKVPVSVYIREGIDMMLKHYAHVLPGQLSLEAPNPASLTPPAPAVAAAVSTARKEPAADGSAPRPTLRTGLPHPPPEGAAHGGGRSGEGGS